MLPRTLTESTAITALSVTLILTGCNALAPEGPDTTNPTGPLTFTKLVDGATVADSSASLERFEDRVELELTTHELEPGHVYSVWMMITNDPAQNADTSMLGTAGGVADDNGSATFLVTRMINDLEGVAFGPGLTNPLEAEITIILRTHGPVIDDSLDEQLSSMNGGCPPNHCQDVQVVNF